MTYKYEWTSVATGEPVTLTQTIDAEKSWYISSTLSMVLRGTTFAADCYGSDFPLVDGYREIKLLSRPGRGTMLRVKTPDAICQQILADYRAAEQAHRDHLLTDANIRYTIHDTTSYGIYNGFNGDLINSMARHYIRQLSEEFAPLISDEFLREVKKALDAQFNSAAQDTYTAFPEGENWSSEYLAVYRASVQDRTAPGVAYFKGADVFAALVEILNKQLPAYADKMATHYRAVAYKASSYPRQYTAEQARASEENYNRVVNEGGEGFVPHIVSGEEAENAREMVAVCNILYRNLTREDRRQIIFRETGEVVATFYTDHSMCLDEALNLVGEIVNDVNDERYSDEGDNVIIDGKRYYYDDLDMEW